MRPSSFTSFASIAQSDLAEEDSDTFRMLSKHFNLLSKDNENVPSVVLGF